MPLGPFDEAARAHAVSEDPLGPASLNLVQLGCLASLAGALALLVLLLTRIAVFPPRRTLTRTEINTLLNRHENGGTGVRARKWRKRLLPPQRFGDEHVLAGAGLDELDGDGTPGTDYLWRVRSRSPPRGLRSCLRRRPAPAADSPVVAGDSLPSEPAPARPEKRVRIAPPALDDLEALRDRWARLSMQGEPGHGGIGGYRSTRDFTARGKGGIIATKPVHSSGASADGNNQLAPGHLIPATMRDDGDDGVDLGEDDTATTSSYENLSRRWPRTSRLSAQGSRASSHSPSPRGRHRRAVSSPSPHPTSGRSASPALVVGLHPAAHKPSPTRRRAFSPGDNTSSSSRRRSASASPRPVAGERAAPTVPKWIRTKGGKLASPAPTRLSVSLDSDEDDVEGEIEFEDALSSDEDACEGRDTGEEGGSHKDSKSSPRGVPIEPTGIAAVAAVIPPLPGGASVRYVPPTASSSPALSVLSGGESPQESPSPSPVKPLASASSDYETAIPPALAVTPASPPAAPVKPLPAASLPPPAADSSASTRLNPSTSFSSTPQSTSSEPARSTPASSTASLASSASPSPSQTAAERRLSLRVEQAIRNKQNKRGESLQRRAHPLPGVTA